MKTIDLRSDTVTKPTSKMLNAMINAEVGDDVYGDDPTVKQLELLSAEMTGFEDALFVASGTMGNQLAIMTHTSKGDEIITGKIHHIVNYEVGAMAVLSSVNVKVIDEVVLTPDAIKGNIRQNNIHFPRTSLVVLENALSNGQVIDKEHFQECIKVAKENNLAVHVDGARIFNASIALKTSVDELVAHADSMMFCLSKGLGAPIGSMLVGSKAFIAKARKYRKMLGGGWRQAGVIASCGIVALTEMVDRLEVDHQNATLLATLLTQDNSITVDLDKLDINMVFYKLPVFIDENDYVNTARDNGFLINPPTNGKFRVMTHINVDVKDVEQFAHFTIAYVQKNREI